MVDLRLDSLGLYDSLLTMGAQIRESVEAYELIEDIPKLDDIDHVLILGMGDAGFSGDIVAALARPHSRKPIVVYNDYLPPSWVGPRTLVLAISASGAASETIESLDSALDCGASLIAVSNGGELEALAKRHGAPVINPVAMTNIPRASLASLSVPALMALRQLEIFPYAENGLLEAIEVVDQRCENVVSDASNAWEIASIIEGSTPVIYGDGTVGTTAAKRWKTAVNHNLKKPAFWAPMPDLCQNDLLGWHEKQASENFTQIQLRHGTEHSKTNDRFSYVQSKTQMTMSEVVTVHARGRSSVAQIFDLVLLGDFVSLELADMAGVDPGPLPVYDDLKKWLI